MRVLFDWNAVVHLVNAQDLGLAAIRTKLVILAHDEGLNRLGWAHFRAQSAEAAPGQVEIEVIEHFDLGSWLAVAAQGNQVVGARLRALITDDAGLGAGAGLGLQPQDAAEAWRGRPPLRRILERKRRLRRVFQRHPQALEQVDQEEGLDELEHYARSPMTTGSLWPRGITRSFRNTVPSLGILSCNRINPYSNASGRGGHPDTYTSTGTTLSTPCSTL